MRSDVLPQRRETSSKNLAEKVARPEVGSSQGSRPKCQSTDGFGGTGTRGACITSALTAGIPIGAMRLSDTGAVPVVVPLLTSGPLQRLHLILLQGPEMERSVAAVGLSSTIGFAAAVGVARVNGISMADLDTRKARETSGHSRHPCARPLPLMVPLWEGTCNALVDESHGCMAHQVGQRTPQFGPGDRGPWCSVGSRSDAPAGRRMALPTKGGGGWANIRVQAMNPGMQVTVTYNSGAPTGRL